MKTTSYMTEDDIRFEEQFGKTLRMKYDRDTEEGFLLQDPDVPTPAKLEYTIEYLARRVSEKGVVYKFKNRLQNIAQLVGTTLEFTSIRPQPKPEEETTHAQSSDDDTEALDILTYRRRAIISEMKIVAEETNTELASVRAKLEELQKKPADFDGTKDAYLQSIAPELEDLRERRDILSRRYTATYRYDPDKLSEYEEAENFVETRLDKLFAQSGGILSERQKEEYLDYMLAVVRESGFYEHYPTPQHIIDKMVDDAAIQPGMLILEPSAGEGYIPDTVRAKNIPGVRIHTIELQDTLQEILKTKGYDVVGDNFMAYNLQGNRIYDRIIMNPPFDHGVDIEHIHHAFSMLKDGGKIIAITSAAAVDGTDTINYEFREFIQERGSYKLLAPKEYMGGSALQNGRSISISIAYIVLERKAGDTFGQVAKEERRYAQAGEYLYDTQGAEFYRVQSIERRKTVLKPLSGGSERTLNEQLRTGARWKAITKAEAEARAEEMKSGSNAFFQTDAKGRFILPKLPPAPNGLRTDMKPLRTILARQEIMPPAPQEILYSERFTKLPNFTFTPLQLDGVNRALHALTRGDGGFLMADGTGFGKTSQALLVASSLIDKFQKPVLIFTKSPSIVETSFFKDARQLGIDTPEAQNAEDRKLFSGKNAAGFAIRRIPTFNGLKPQQLKGKYQKGIYIASYHVFGGWDGDATEYERMTTFLAKTIRPMETELSKAKKNLERTYRDPKMLAEAKQNLDKAFHQSPQWKQYQRLRAEWERVNMEFFKPLAEQFQCILSDEAHAYKNYNPDDMEDGSKQAFRGMILNSYSPMRMYLTATPIDKVDHIRYLKPLGVYKTDKQYARLMQMLGYRFHEQEYVNGTLVSRSRWTIDKRVPPESALMGIGRLFENLTMSNVMVKRELSLDNFEAINVMIPPKNPDGTLSFRDEEAKKAALNQLAVVTQALKPKKRCKASIINEMKFTLEPYKIPKVIEIVKQELSEGRQVVVYCSLVNNTYANDKCVAINKQSTVNKLRDELGRLFGEETIGFVVGKRSEGSSGCLDCDTDDEGNDDDSTGGGLSDSSLEAERHEQKYFGKIDIEPEQRYVGLADARLQRQRNDDIGAFQKGQKRILIATAEAGGTGISLDDTIGNAPRTIIMMTAPFSATEVVQILGRINRQQTKSPQRAYFLWMDVPIDRRLRDIIATKLAVLGAAVQGEVDKVSVEEAEFGSTESVQDDTDKHNRNEKGELLQHSLALLSKINGIEIKTTVRRPYIIENVQNRMSNEIVNNTRKRGNVIIIRPAGKEYGVQVLKQFERDYADVMQKYNLKRESSRYEGSWIEGEYEGDLWNWLLNFLKPENTRFFKSSEQMFRVGDRVRLVMDSFEADTEAGTPGTVTRVWRRQIKALDVSTGKPIDARTGEVIMDGHEAPHKYNYFYDYMVDFDNGERANNIEGYELVPFDADTGDNDPELDTLREALAQKAADEFVEELKRKEMWSLFLEHYKLQSPTIKTADMLVRLIDKFLQSRSEYAGLDIKEIMDLVAKRIAEENLETQPEEKDEWVLGEGGTPMAVSSDVLAFKEHLMNKKHKDSSSYWEYYRLIVQQGGTIDPLTINSLYKIFRQNSLLEEKPLFVKPINDTYRSEIVQLLANDKGQATNLIDVAEENLGTQPDEEPTDIGGDPKNPDNFNFSRSPDIELSELKPYIPRNPLFAMDKENLRKINSGEVLYTENVLDLLRFEMENLSLMLFDADTDWLIDKQRRIYTIDPENLIQVLALEPREKRDFGKIDNTPKTVSPDVLAFKEFLMNEKDEDSLPMWESMSYELQNTDSLDQSKIDEMYKRFSMNSLKKARPVFVKPLDKASRRELMILLDRDWTRTTPLNDRLVAFDSSAAIRQQIPIPNLTFHPDIHPTDLVPAPEAHSILGDHVQSVLNKRRTALARTITPRTALLLAEDMRQANAEWLKDSAGRYYTLVGADGTQIHQLVR